MRYIIGMLLAGFVCFFLLGLRKGFSFRELCGMTGRGAREAIDVGKMLLLIGIAPRSLTHTWITLGLLFVYLALLVAFLLLVKRKKKAE